VTGSQSYNYTYVIPISGVAGQGGLGYGFNHTNKE
jgi:hypothetical protein